jgi:acyl-CoA thioester hydrolase
MKSRTVIVLEPEHIDELGHVNQAALHSFLGSARASTFGDLTDFAFALVRVEMDFRAEVTLDQGRIEVLMWTESVGRSSFTLAHQILLPDQRIAAEGRTVLVSWNRTGRCSQPLTDQQRAFLGRGLARR